MVRLTSFCNLYLIELCDTFINVSSSSSLCTTPDTHLVFVDANKLLSCILIFTADTVRSVSISIIDIIGFICNKLLIVLLIPIDNEYDVSFAIDISFLCLYFVRI
eukprot:804133_1